MMKLSLVNVGFDEAQNFGGKSGQNGKISCTPRFSDKIRGAQYMYLRCEALNSLPYRCQH
jgi:hypothetical protein